MKLLNCLLLILIGLVTQTFAQNKIFVSPNLSSKGIGTFANPYNSLELALENAKKFSNKDVVIELRKGNYYLEKTIILDSNEFQLKSLVIKPYQKEQVTVFGAKPYQLNWQNLTNHIWKAQINLVDAPDSIYLNGESLRMARYPNFDPNKKPFQGTGKDAINAQRIKDWKVTDGIYVHGLQDNRWGSLHYLSKGKDEKGELILEGGWQINRDSKLNVNYRFVENVFEELDAPGEWFYDKAEKILYLIPPTGVNLNKSKLTIAHLSELIVLKGDTKRPLKNISIQNIQFTQTNRTFMRTKEPMLRSDWAIYRGGAILLDGTENIKIQNCVFNEIGGNAIFLSNYNRNVEIKDNHLFNLGASGILFVGNPKAVRSPIFRYEEVLPLDKIDYQPGPQKDDYPQDCSAEGNLIHNIGLIEKQTAGVGIDMASRIKVSHNSIYKTPRAGINIGGGTWGGHLIENNDVFETVLETGDNGAFNSWGRDRFWQSDKNEIEKIVESKKGIELLDVVAPIIIRNNRFRCDHGWDIDLDDGSSNYEIYNNLLLNGGLKLREGYHRKVYNNILINNTLHPHVWLKDSNDIFENNIVTISYAPIFMDHWGKSIDKNYFLSNEGLSYAQAKKLDQNSQVGEANFINAEVGNFQLKSSSKAFKLGYTNFKMDFGVTEPRLKKMTEKPLIPKLITSFKQKENEETYWLGARVKNVETLGEQSAFGLGDKKGIIVLNVPNDSLAHKNGVKKGDVLIRLGNTSTNSLFDLFLEFQKIKWQGYSDAIFFRNQTEVKLSLKLSE